MPGTGVEIGLSLLLISPLIFSAVLGPILAFIIYRNKDAPGARPLIAMLLAASLWSIGYALEMLSQDFTSTFFWARIQYLGIAILPLTWHLFAIQYLGNRKWSLRSRIYRLMTVLIPSATILLVWTNEAHRLVWTQTGLLAIGPFQILDVEYGPWFWVHITYVYSLMLIASVRLIEGLVRSVRHHRWQILVVLLAVVFPWLGNLVYLTDINPVPGWDWTPFAFTLSGILFTFSLLQFNIVRIIPIAQQTVFAGLPESVFVLDLQDCIVDLNNAARKLINEPLYNPLGNHFSVVLPQFITWIEAAKTRGDQQFEVSMGKEPGTLFYDLSISTITNADNQPIGWLVVLHDITQQKNIQRQLEKARLELEQIVAQKTEDLRNTINQLQSLTSRLNDIRESERQEIASYLHDQVGQNLTGLNLNLQILENQLSSMPDQDLTSRLIDSRKLVEETTRMVRQFMVDLHPPILDDYGLVPALKWYSNQFSSRTEIPVQVTASEDIPDLPKKTELILFRIVQEILNNVAKHAQASQVKISLENIPGELILRVRDNGIGFDPAAPADPDQLTHWGLIHINQMADSIGGKLEIISAKSAGTQVFVRLLRRQNEH